MARTAHGATAAAAPAGVDANLAAQVWEVCHLVMIWFFSLFIVVIVH